MTGTLITGGTGGIGTALVRTLRKAGREVMFTFKSQAAKAQELAAETGAHALPYDSTDPAGVECLCQRIRASELEGLVNLAADRMNRRPFLKLSCDALLGGIALGLSGPLRLSQAFAQRCHEQSRSGVIVNVLSSVTLGSPPENVSGYVILKHALLGATRALAVEFAKHGIRVNAVSPGMTRTSYLSDLPDRLLQMVEEDLPFKRLAQPEEVAQTVAFLLSPDASYIHGANIPITGGAVC